MQKESAVAKFEAFYILCTDSRITAQIRIWHLQISGQKLSRLIHLARYVSTFENSERELDELRWQSSLALSGGRGGGNLSVNISY
jgi:hypothetical protein